MSGPGYDNDIDDDEVDEVVQQAEEEAALDLASRLPSVPKHTPKASDMRSATTTQKPTARPQSQPAGPKQSREDREFAELEAQAEQEMASFSPGASLRQSAQETNQAAKQFQAALAQAEADHARAQEEAKKIIAMYSTPETEKAAAEEKTKEGKKPPLWKRIVNRVKETVQSAWASVKSALGTSKKTVTYTSSEYNKPKPPKPVLQPKKKQNVVYTSSSYVEPKTQTVANNQSRPVPRQPATAALTSQNTQSQDALKKLQKAREASAKQQQALVSKIQATTNKALAAKKAGNREQALMHLKARKLLRQQLAQQQRTARNVLKMENSLTKAAGKPAAIIPSGTPPQGRSTGRSGPQVGG